MQGTTVLHFLCTHVGHEQSTGGRCEYYYRILGNLRPLSRPCQVQRVRTDPHAPNRYRTDGTVANIPEFAEAFKCSKWAKVRESSVPEFCLLTSWVVEPSARKEVHLLVLNTVTMSIFDIVLGTVHMYFIPTSISLHSTGYDLCNVFP